MVDTLKARVHEILDRHGFDYKLDWELSGKPFLTPKGELANAMSSAITQATTLEPQLSTSGGTSDGRFIADICAQVIEFGPRNATIHKLNEHVEVDDLEKLSQIYQLIMENLLVDKTVVTDSDTDGFWDKLKKYFSFGRGNPSRLMCSVGFENSKLASMLNKLLSDPALSHCQNLLKMLALLRGFIGGHQHTV